MKHRLLLGAHMSIAGSIDQSIDRGESIFCTTMQIFLKSNRRWITPPLSDEEIFNFRAKTKKTIIRPIVAHTAYLINLGSTNNDIADKSFVSFKDELQRTELLGIPYLVIHPGSAAKEHSKDIIGVISTQINNALSEVPGSTIILLETMAGQGSSLGHTFEQLGSIIKNVHDHKRIGICFDTCHSWASGYDFSTTSNYEKMWLLFDTIIGLHKLHAIHINDSKNLCGSRVDRHEDIGKGHIGLEPFRLLMNDERFFDIPKILETPKETEQDDLRNMKTLISLISPETRKQLLIHDELASGNS